MDQGSSQHCFKCEKIIIDHQSVVQFQPILHNCSFRIYIHTECLNKHYPTIIKCQCADLTGNEIEIEHNSTKFTPIENKQ